MEYSKYARDLSFRFSRLQAQLELFEGTRWPEDKDRAVTIALDLQERLAALIHQLDTETTRRESPKRPPPKPR